MHLNYSCLWTSAFAVVTKRVHFPSKLKHNRVFAGVSDTGLYLLYYRLFELPGYPR